jgi:hypothetical protein
MKPDLQARCLSSPCSTDGRSRLGSRCARQKRSSTAEYAGSLDPEQVARPRRWNIAFIGRFMLVFGFVSAIVDFVTFAVLLIGFHARPELFRTA